MKKIIFSLFLVVFLFSFVDAGPTKKTVVRKPVVTKLWKNMNQVERAEYKYKEAKNKLAKIKKETDIRLKKAQSEVDAAKEKLEKAQAAQLLKAKNEMEKAKAKYEEIKSKVEKKEDKK